MRPVKCAGCNCVVYDYQEYDEFQLCRPCEEEMIEEDERRIEEEEEAFITMYCYKGE